MSLDMELVTPTSSSFHLWDYDTPSSPEVHSDGSSDANSSLPVTDSAAIPVTVAALLEKLASGYRELWEQTLDVLAYHPVFESEEQGRPDNVLTGGAPPLYESSLVQDIAKM